MYRVVEVVDMIQKHQIRSIHRYRPQNNVLVEPRHAARPASDRSVLGQVFVGAACGADFPPACFERKRPGVPADSYGERPKGQRDTVHVPRAQSCLGQPPGSGGIAARGIGVMPSVQNREPEALGTFHEHALVSGERISEDAVQVGANETSKRGHIARKGDR